MKTYPVISSRFAFVCAALFGAASLNAQEPLPVSPPPVVEDAPTVADAPQIGADQLEELVAPIALYPDALIALILPASTVSSDIVLAARFLKGGESLTEIDGQPWDDSVKGLAHYPDVVKWLDENLSWTQQLGEAYLAEPQAVMDAIQRARALARSNGVLTDTPQQRVVIEDNYIRIIPAKPDVIYVPRYDPEIIYVQRPLYYYPDPWLSFGIGFGVGSWLSYDLDWRTHRIWVNHNRDHWRQHRDWRHRHFPGRPGYVHRDSQWRHWTPSVTRPRAPHRDGHHRWGRDFARPTPLPGAPRFDRERWINRDRDRRDHFSGGGRPGVVRPDRDRTRDVQRDHSRDGQHDRRAEWRNRERLRDGQPRSDRPDLRSLRRERAESSVSNNSAPSSSQIAPTPTPQVQRSIPPQRRSHDRVNRPSGDNRFSQRRSEAVAPSSSVDRRHITPPTRAQSGFRENVQRPQSTERRDHRQFRQAPPSSQRPAVIASRPAPAMARPPATAAQMRTAPQHREFRHAQRVAPPARVSPPAPAASAPVARSVEAPQSRGDHGSRPAASYGGRGEGRGSRGNRAER